MANMKSSQTLPSTRQSSPRPNTYRQRSNSFPIVEALGCSTPEAQLILAEGRAAVRKRRARDRRNKSVDDEDVTTFDPREHMKYLENPAAWDQTQEQPQLSHARSCHARLPSNATDRSTSTIVPQPREADTHNVASPTSPLGNYSANLAEFIKAQLRSIPTYQSNHDATSPLSPRSCPDFSFPARAPSQSSDRSTRRHVDAPKVIEIPPIKAPARSAFSAWSSTDDETDEEELPLPDEDNLLKTSLSKGSNYAPSILGYYEHNNSSFLLSSTPMEEDDEPETAKAVTFPDQHTLPGSDSEHVEGNDYPSSCLSRPQLSTSSAPSGSSASASVSSSYFDCKRPISLTPDMKGRIIAALTPPVPHSNIITAISPWEGAAITNVHDVFIESQHRVRVDGMSFDMIGDFPMPNRVSTPC